MAFCFCFAGSPQALSLGHVIPSDSRPPSHSRHRSGSPPHRLRRDRERRQPPHVCRLRLSPAARYPAARKPAEAAVEQTFVNKDGVATLKLGQARGVAMLAPARFGISVSEYAPNQVKKTVVGVGHADKNQVMVMLKLLLPKAEPASADAADALAIAITHAHHRSTATLRLKVIGA